MLPDDVQERRRQDGRLRELAGLQLDPTAVFHLAKLLQRLDLVAAGLGDEVMGAVVLCIERRRPAHPDVWEA